MNPSHYIIDSGNTRTKIAKFSESKLEEISYKTDQEALDIQVSDTGLYCSVNRSHEEFSNLKNINDYLEQIKFKSHYSQTLGVDRRILIASTLKEEHQVSSTVIIDAGSFITVDFIDKDTHLGGYIYPGIENFLYTYSKNGRHLPKVEYRKVDQQIPQNTEEAIAFACSNYLNSISSICKDYKRIIITGGDSHKIAEFFDSKEIVVDENLLLKSLNKIYLNLIN